MLPCCSAVLRQCVRTCVAAQRHLPAQHMGVVERGARVGGCHGAMKPCAGMLRVCVCGAAGQSFVTWWCERGKGCIGMLSCGVGALGLPPGCSV